MTTGDRFTLYTVGALAALACWAGLVGFSFGLFEAWRAMLGMSRSGVWHQGLVQNLIFWPLLIYVSFILPLIVFAEALYALFHGLRNK